MLMIAAAHGQLRICDILLQHRADVNALDANRHSRRAPFPTRTRLPYPPGINEVCRMTDRSFGTAYRSVHWRSFCRLTALINAATLGHAEVCLLLIEQKADLHAKTTEGETALSSAAGAAVKVVSEALKLAMLDHY